MAAGDTFLGLQKPCSAHPPGPEAGLINKQLISIITITIISIIIIVIIIICISIIHVNICIYVYTYK